MEILHLDTSSGWRDPIIAYLKDRTLLSDKASDKAEAQKFQHMATMYILNGKLLYKKFYSKVYSDPYLRCFGSEEARRVMPEMHDDCENDTGG